MLMITFKDFRAMNNVLPNCEKFKLQNIATILGVSTAISFKKLITNQVLEVIEATMDLNVLYVVLVSGA